jgi:hypothetical protein
MTKISAVPAPVTINEAAPTSVKKCTLLVAI